MVRKSDDELSSRWRDVISSFAVDTQPSDDGWQQLKTRKVETAKDPVPSKLPARLLVAACAAAVLAVGGAALVNARDVNNDATLVVGHEGDEATSTTLDATTLPATETSVPVAEYSEHPIGIEGLPKGSKLVDSTDGTSPLGSTTKSTLYLLPGTASNGRDMTIRVTTMRNEKASEFFANSTAGGKDLASGSPLSQAEVRGTSAVLASFQVGSDTITICRWLETNDVQVEAAAYNVDQDALLRYVEATVLPK